MKEWSTMKKLIWLRKYSGGGGATYETLTGKIISFIAQRVDAIKSLSIAIEPVQSGTGDPSPDNVRPISGWTGATVNRTGKNLFDKNSIQIEQGAIASASGQDSSSVNRIRSKEYMPVFSATQYVLTATGTATKYYGHFYDAEENYIGNTSGWVNIGLPFATPSGAAFARFVFANAQDDRITPSGIDNIQVELGSTASSYEPYSGTSVSLTFGSTVYGGQATDNGDGSWTVKVFPYYASYNGEPLVGPWLSSMDKYAAGTTPTTGAQVVDLGGTQTTFTVSGDTLSSLVGNNNVWASTGDITATVQTN